MSITVPLVSKLSVLSGLFYVSLWGIETRVTPAQFTAQALAVSYLKGHFGHISLLVYETSQILSLEAQEQAGKILS